MRKRPPASLHLRGIVILSGGIDSIVNRVPESKDPYLYLTHAGAQKVSSQSIRTINRGLLRKAGNHGREDLKGWATLRKVLWDAVHFHRLMALLIQLVSLVVIASTAIRKAEDTDWKWANAGIVVGGIVVGIFVAAVIGFVIQDANFLPAIGPILAVSLGLLAATVPSLETSGGQRESEKATKFSTRRAIRLSSSYLPRARNRAGHPPDRLRRASVSWIGLHTVHAA